ncbi:hypothetical protein [Zooshikella ganghwensis]|uniref:hypothetical protein n=1 Tax=Zooshikella ganghwensis TaxID=202772 RepID=UPI000408B8FF|nr:hypothetical protein [Zooshikella ganghwensis]
MVNFDELAKEYFEAFDLKDRNMSHHAIQKIVNSVASNLPKDNPEALSWFIAALKDPQKKWFVAKVMEKVMPVPISLLDDLVLAALLEPNPSNNKLFVLPCVKTFGADQVRKRMVELSNYPGVKENNGFDMVSYWVRDIV